MGLHLKMGKCYRVKSLTYTIGNEQIQAKSNKITKQRNKHVLSHCFRRTTNT